MTGTYKLKTVIKIGKKQYVHYQIIDQALLVYIVITLSKTQHGIINNWFLCTRKHLNGYDVGRFTGHIKTHFSKRDK